jgi:hypothetical protein
MYENFRTGKRYKNKRLAIKNSNVGDEIARYKNINKDWNGNAPGLYLQPLDDYVVKADLNGKKYLEKDKY